MVWTHGPTPGPGPVRPAGMGQQVVRHLVRDLSDILALDGDGHVLRASLPAPSSPPTEVRLGGEWKIDRIELPQP